jgi:hypothetical protein
MSSDEDGACSGNESGADSVGVITTHNAHAARTNAAAEDFQSNIGLLQNDLDEDEKAWPELNGYAACLYVANKA